VGGSGLYLQAVVEGFNLSHTPPDPEKRKELEEMDETELFSKLEGINPVFAGRIKDSDRKNKRRLVRYIEICREQAEEGIRKQKTPYSFLLIGVSMEKNVLDQKIYKRLLERVEKEGMIQEVSGLHKNEGVSWKRLKQFGLEYRYIAEYLQEELGYEEMIEKLYTAIKRFSRRQMTWFRRWERQGADICWVTKNKEAQRISKNFLE
jgi:tRNA dimethylallyltransferase